MGHATYEIIYNVKGNRSGRRNNASAFSYILLEEGGDFLLYMTIHLPRYLKYVFQQDLKRTQSGPLVDLNGLGLDLNWT